jgi:hypothetical protein
MLRQDIIALETVLKPFRKPPDHWAEGAVFMKVPKRKLNQHLHPTELALRNCPGRFRD